jgi:ATP-dependent DNA helicase RecG
VLFFAIPSAPTRFKLRKNDIFTLYFPVSFRLDKLDERYFQTLTQDWTAQVVPGATLDALDDNAVSEARKAFAQKHANRFVLDEINRWPLSTFLDRAHLTQDGRITRTALLLLGKRESAWRLSPHPTQLTWSLEGQERAYEHFSLPFLISTTELYQRIRNIQLRILPPNKLVAVEIPKYDRKVVLEALHNCIAHQDYLDRGRIVVREQLDRLIFQNVGSFFEGQPESYIGGTKVPVRYRNPFLVRAMSKLNMIDTMGLGIYDMYKRQAQRYFPLPDYDLSERGITKITIYGSMIDMAYSNLLLQKTDLPLADVIMLDRVQKKLPISDIAAVRLRQARLIKGRKPHYVVSNNTAIEATTG